MRLVPSPCPWCGERKNIGASDEGCRAGFREQCFECLACGPHEDTEDQAISMWNRLADVADYLRGLDPENDDLNADGGNTLLWLREILGRNP